MEADPDDGDACSKLPSLGHPASSGQHGLAVYPGSVEINASEPSVVASSTARQGSIGFLTITVRK